MDYSALFIPSLVAIEENATEGITIHLAYKNESIPNRTMVGWEAIIYLHRLTTRFMDMVNHSEGKE